MSDEIIWKRMYKVDELEKRIKELEKKGQFAYLEVMEANLKKEIAELKELKNVNDKAIKDIREILLKLSSEYIKKSPIDMIKEFLDDLEELADSDMYNTIKKKWQGRLK